MPRGRRPHPTNPSTGTLFTAQPAPSQSSQPQTLTLYPGHWLYNAGVIGFLRVLEGAGLKVESLLKEDCVVVDSGHVQQAFAKFIKLVVDPDSGEYKEWKQKWENETINLERSRNEKDRRKAQKRRSQLNNFGKWVNWLRINEPHILLRFFGKMFGSRTPFQNLVQSGEYDEFLNLVQNILQRVSHQYTMNKNMCCVLCGNFFDEPLTKLEVRVTRFQDPHTRDIPLGPSYGESPNTFWNMDSSICICYACVYFMLFTPPRFNLAWINFSKIEQIFINAPSFQVMWHLNKYAEVIEKNSSAREILGLSLIEATIKEQLTLHRWTAHNVEVVVKKGDKIDFVSVPGEVVQILNNYDVAKLFKKISELSILKLVLDQKWDRLMEVGYRLIRITGKENYSNSEKDYIREWLPYNARRNPEILKPTPAGKRKLLNIAHQLLLLHAHIRETLKIH